jgi:hypothetical protein
MQWRDRRPHVERDLCRVGNPGCSSGLSVTIDHAASNTVGVPEGGSTAAILALGLAAVFGMAHHHAPAPRLRAGGGEPAEDDALLLRLALSPVSSGNHSHHAVARVNQMDH